MIIRDHDQTIIMIEQNHHAHISAEIISNWQDIFFEEDPYFESVLYAIKQHDYGWHAFDSQPFLNDFLSYLKQFSIHKAWIKLNKSILMLLLYVVHIICVS